MVRPAIDHLLAHRCTIQRSNPANVDGVIVHEWEDVATGVRCLVQEDAGGPQKNEGGLTYTSGATGYFRPGTDLRPNTKQDQPDRIVMTSPSRLAGTVYQVGSVADESGVGHHLVATLSRYPEL